MGSSTFLSWALGIECHPELGRARSNATATRRPGTRRVLRARTYLRRTSDTGMGSATHCPSPPRRRCRRTRTAAGCPIEAALSPWPAFALCQGLGLWPLLARLLIANLINAQRGEAGKRGNCEPHPAEPRRGRHPSLAPGVDFRAQGKDHVSNTSY